MFVLDSLWTEILTLMSLALGYYKWYKPTPVQWFSTGFALGCRFYIGNQVWPITNVNVKKNYLKENTEMY